MKFKTKNLIIVSLDEQQMLQLSKGDASLFDSLGALPGAAADEHLLSAYGEMYKNCVENPKDILWYTNWQIILKSENRVIGSIGFMGPANENKEITVGYGIDEAYRGHGYACEALKCLTEWAFSGKPYFIRAEVERDNAASVKVLEKCGFKIADDSGENIIYELERPASAWLSVYMCLGMSCGMCLGAAFDNMMTGMCIGIAIGTALGAAMDAEDKKNRKR